MPACAVLHVTSLPGGGVDRHIRDIARGSPRRHLAWHAAEGCDAIEVLGERRVHALAPDATQGRGAALADWLRRQGVGLVHAHSVAAAPRERAAWAASALGVPTIATLHDVLFLRPDGFEPGAPRTPDAAWLMQTGTFLAAAAERVAPSDFIAGLARRFLPGLEVAVIPNGSPTRAAPCAREPRPEFAARRPRRAALVLGAIGPHKGARVIEEAAALLEGSGIAIVVVGYLDTQLDPGWRSPHLFIHGAWDDDEVAALAAAYGAQLALFPNQAPESFSYTLSDAWDAGLPALVAPEGALAERVARTGAGWLLPAGFGAAEVAAELRRLLSPAGEAELARVKSVLSNEDAGRVPRLDEMTRSLEALYARFGIDPAAPAEPDSRPAQELIARSLDGALFRQELARAADELAQVKAALAAERDAAERFRGEARGWIAKLEADVAALNGQLAEEVAERRRLGEENAHLALHKAAFDLLPRRLRSWLLRKAGDARS